MRSYVNRNGALALIAALCVLPATASGDEVAAPSAPGKPRAAGKPRAERARVVSITDGDTIRVRAGGREDLVRVLAIDTPEVYGDPECGGAQASRSMERILDPGDRVRLVRDPSQPNRDVYDRLLRYVEIRGRDVGKRQVQLGWASVYVYDPPARRVREYRRAAGQAKQRDRGVWKRCGGF